VVYACSSIQLVEQTASKAAGYGLQTTTYAKSQFSNQLATAGEAICITTYQALFNGKSIFARREIAGIVFDDAHTAEHMLRDQFTIHIAKASNSSLYSAVCNEFAQYHRDTGRATSFEDIIGGRSNALLMVPPFEVRRSFETIRKLLRDSSVPNDPKTLFAWEHLKDKIDLCAFLIGPNEVAITPPFLPAKGLPYFSNEIRRIYLSATLTANDAFVRAFGRTPSRVVAPTTKAGECERMILIPRLVEPEGDEIELAKAIVAPYKALILAPSHQRGSIWSDIAHLPDRDDAADQIEAFKLQSGNEKLVLAARYDGVDLPGDTCRLVAIDELPSGVSLLERFQWEYLRQTALLRSVIASRIVQSFGRIFRGMSDYGVVLVTGKRLWEWLQSPANLAELPAFLQKQLQLGIQLSQVREVSISSLVADCFSRSAKWKDLYQTFMQTTEIDNQSDGDLHRTGEDTIRTELALAEADFAVLMWDRQYSKAAISMQGALNTQGHLSPNTVSWYKLWLGYAQEHAGDIQLAQKLYEQAHAGQRNIPPQAFRDGQNQGIQVRPQARKVSVLFSSFANGAVRVPKTLESDLAALQGGRSSKQVEEAIRCLGSYLGFESSRPDNEERTGPDVLWLTEDATAICLEAKTDKESGSGYGKADVGQLADHVQWVKDNYPDVKRIIPCFVGPVVSASASANPAENMMVLPLARLHIIAQSTIAALHNVAGATIAKDLDSELDREYEKRGLLWPGLEKRLEMVSLKSLTK
jgi:hypothetical protein